MRGKRYSEKQVTPSLVSRLPNHSLITFFPFSPITNKRVLFNFHFPLQFSLATCTESVILKTRAVLTGPCVDIDKGIGLIKREKKSEVEVYNGS